jgi:hypothetical protein
MMALGDWIARTHPMGRGMRRRLSLRELGELSAKRRRVDLRRDDDSRTATVLIPKGIFAVAASWRKHLISAEGLA